MLPIVLTLMCSKPGENTLKLHWQSIPPLPPEAGKEVQPGVAGALAGAHGAYMMVAGGANFEKGMPWEGGPKLLHDTIFLLSGQDGWRQLKEVLPRPAAYAACVSLPQGVLAAGGDIEGGQTGEVFLFTFAGGSLQTTSLPPPLPRPVSAAGAAVIAGNQVYLGGGMDAGGACAGFYLLEMNHPEKGWMILPPLPQPLSHLVVVSQHDGVEMCVYVLGGRFRDGEVSTFSSDIWKYTPSKRTWQREGSILCDGRTCALSAGTGIAVGERYILLIGGDRGDLFNKTERFNNEIEQAASEAERAELSRRKTAHLTGHPGFSRKILGYDTIQRTWSTLGETPEAAQVTTPVFYLGRTIVIPSGEVRPGIRTPHIAGLRIED